MKANNLCVLCDLCGKEILITAQRPLHSPRGVIGKIVDIRVGAASRREDCEPTPCVHRICAHPLVAFPTMVLKRQYIMGCIACNAL
jgi:hypothetical protein